MLEDNTEPTNAEDYSQHQVYKVYCVNSAYKEWTKLNHNHSVRLKFIKKLKKLITNPRMESNRLSSELSDCYKIKLRRDGFRLVYQVIDDKVILLIWAIDKRDKKRAYELATQRINNISKVNNEVEIELNDD